MAYYHPSNEVLMRFSAGQLSNALGIMVACHVEECEQCEHRSQFYDQIGGEILDGLEPNKQTAKSAQTSDATSTPVEVKQEMLNVLLETLTLDYNEDEPAKGHGKDTSIRYLSKEHSEKKPISRIPRPLRRFMNTDFEHLPWRGISENIKEFNLPFSDREFKAKLYKIKAGKELPQHTHKGNEYTLVMSGSFEDEAGDYHPGDFVLADADTVHRPKAKPDQDCICFAVLDAPLQFTGPLGWVLNPFLRLTQ